MKYQPVIGLEVHIELKTKSKMFCSCQNDSLEKHPNVNICPICLAHPGTLPVINNEAVRKVIKAGLALNCKISKLAKFDRKSYFYPDIPKGYQISQYDMPFCENGFLKVGDRKIEITRIHLEEDTGRLIHLKGENYSLVDFNRAGVPLMELVTEPQITSAAEAKEFAQKLQLIVRYINISDANMEAGQMRVEANISLSKPGSGSKNSKLGTKVEIKNLNSFKVVEKAINYEIKRQAKALDNGEDIVQETRGWDELKENTFSQRKKEKAHDYRYFPEPDLPPLSFTDQQISIIKKEIPELPEAKKERLIKEYGLDEKNAYFFVQNKGLGEYFEKVISELSIDTSGEDIKKLTSIATNYILTDLQGMLKGANLIEKDFLITPENFAELIILVGTKKILSNVAKTVLLEMFQTGADPSHIIDEKGLSEMKDEDKILGIIKEILLKNKKAVSDFKEGKQNALQFLLGQVMAKTKGRVNPNEARKRIEKEINN
jgi:aspartyl-tRNA(Asn)/glutamyl-tRNA(Gln) amidotransferase subunit B